MFYINYEECKYYIATSVHKLNHRFILTMRNVNLRSVGDIADVMYGFILTMRNVNILYA